MGNLDISKFMQEHYKREDFSHLNWSGSFQEYLDKVAEDPRIARNAFQRIFDMILQHGTSKYTEKALDEHMSGVSNNTKRRTKRRK